MALCYHVFSFGIVTCCMLTSCKRCIADTRMLALCERVRSVNCDMAKHDTVFDARIGACLCTAGPGELRMGCSPQGRAHVPSTLSGAAAPDALPLLVKW